MTERNIRASSAANGPGLQRRTLFDSLEPLEADRNLYCRRADLGNEASVETFFLARMISDLGFRDDQVRTKERGIIYNPTKTPLDNAHYF